jgi:hypothetical protein
MHLQEECMLAQIPPNIENKPQNRGLESIPRGDGLLTGSKVIPHAAK